MADLHVLDSVWGAREGYVFVPRWLITEADPKTGKPKGRWDEGRAFRWPEEKDAVHNRVLQSADEGYEVYWCPVVFPHPRRKQYNDDGDYIGPEKLDLLWADLDEVDPNTCDPKPHVAWETSTGRYAALWYLDEARDAQEVLHVNRNLTNFLGADPGGWDLTQVLRVPGTVNRKYGHEQRGVLLWHVPRGSGHVSWEHVTSLSAHVRAEPERVESTNLEGIARRLSPRTLQLLNTDPADVVVGERSERLWELEKRLIEDGVPINVALEYVKKSPWNKHKGRRDEDGQIMRELLKAEQEIRERSLPRDDADADWTTPFDEFIQRDIDPPGWVVEGIWQDGYGMIAGEPKTYKSVTAVDLALSVATGRPFLNKFPVKKPMPVLLIQEENSEATIQDRVIRIAAQKDILVRQGARTEFPSDIEFRLSNNQGVNLLDTEWRDRIEATIRKHGIKLLILDPLYMMIGDADENSAKEMNSILTWLTYLRNEYGVYSVVVHHYNKGQHSKRGGQKVRGTSAFHGWVETGLYLSLTEQSKTVNMAREFRSMSPGVDLKIRYDFDLRGYTPSVAEEGQAQSAAVEYQKEQIVTMLKTKGPMTLREVSDALKTREHTARRWLNDLRDSGEITTDRRGRATVYLIAKKDEDNVEIPAEES